jgi:fatty-acid peroxygenase
MPPSDCPHAATAPPRLRFDRSAALLRHGYPYLSGLRRRAHAATLELRLLGRPATVLSGEQGARLFYDESAMRRRGAIPYPLRRVLFGRGAVHGLDGADHTHRKALFLDLLTPEAAKAVAELAAGHWHDHDGDPVDPAAVLDEAVQVHTAAVLEWAGVPAADTYPELAHDLIAMVDGFGSVGPRYWRAVQARRRAERWARDLVAGIRDGRRAVSGTPVGVLVTHHGRDGALLPPRVAGVELLNILRPTVAVAYFVAFTAEALATHPPLRRQVADGDEEFLESLAAEVRRHYPFVPMLAARARRPVQHDGVPVPRGRRVVLDVYGTLHDPGIWTDPERFDPARFVGRDPDPFTFLPQGGGDPATGHRCPGERVAIELLKTAARHLALDRPPVRGAAGYPLSRIPTRPRPAAG